METAFYIAGAVAIISTVFTITRLNAVHALLYLVVSLLAVAVAFYTMGAPLVAALEVIIYAGAIMVLFVFVVMMLNLGKRAVESERRLMQGKIWVGPSVLSALLIVEVVYLIARAEVCPGIPAGSGSGVLASEAGRDRSVWALPDWRGTGFHVAAGRPGGSLPPGPARIRESRGSL